MKYWLYSLCSTIQPVSYLFYMQQFVLLISQSYFPPLQPLLPLITSSLFSPPMSLFLFCLFVKSTISRKSNKVRHKKMRYAYTETQTKTQPAPASNNFFPTREKIRKHPSYFNTAASQPFLFLPASKISALLKFMPNLHKPWPLLFRVLD